MSSTQVTEMNRGISLAIKVYEARLVSSILAQKSLNPSLELSSGGQTMKSIPSRTEGLSFAWDSYFSLELEDPNEVEISLTQHRFLFKNISLAKIRIPFDWFLKGKNIGWWKIYSQEMCIGKMLIGFVSDEYFKDIELERLHVRFSIRSYLGKLKKVKNQCSHYKNRMKELLGDSEQDTKIYLSNIRSEREDVQMRIQEAAKKIQVYIRRMKDFKDRENTKPVSVSVPGHPLRLSTNSTLR